MPKPEVRDARVLGDAGEVRRAGEARRGEKEMLKEIDDAEWCRRGRRCKSQTCRRGQMREAQAGKRPAGGGDL
jgi:hypothetical protein